MTLAIRQWSVYSPTMGKDAAADEAPDERARRLMAEARELRARAVLLEREAFREALRVAGWLERPAADLLGVSRSGFKHLLAKRHPEVYAEVLAAREAMGYERGNPELIRGEKKR